MQSIPQHLDPWRVRLKGGTFPRAVVLGATGRLGSVLRMVWPDAWPVVWSGRRAGPGITVCEPLRDPDGLRRLLTGAEVVLSLAGSPGGDLADHAALARALSEATDAPRLLASSAAVYGRAGEGGQTLRAEMKLPDDLSPYGAAKRAMEEESDATALRIGNVAGEDAILGGWREGFQLDTFADGRTPRRSYIGPVTLALTLAELCRRAPDLPPRLNVAQPGPMEMGQLLDAAGRPFTPRPAPPNAIAEVALETAPLCRLIPELPPADAETLVSEAAWVSRRRAQL